MALSADLMTELDKDWADGQRARADNRNHDGQRLRGFQDGLLGALEAAASNVMLLSSLPDEAMGSKLAYDTPRSSQNTVTPPTVTKTA